MAKKIQDIRTRDDFIQWIEANHFNRNDTETADTADWFIAVTNARLVFDSYSTKDLADLFLNGIPGVKTDPEEAHRDFWNSYFEDVDHYRAEGYEEDACSEEESQVENVRALLEYFFNCTLKADA